MGTAIIITETKFNLGQYCVVDVKQIQYSSTNPQAYAYLSGSIVPPTHR